MSARQQQTSQHRPAPRAWSTAAVPVALTKRRWLLALAAALEAAWIGALVRMALR